jgi:hypothetical protein
MIMVAVTLPDALTVLIGIMTCWPQLASCLEAARAAGLEPATL